MRILRETLHSHTISKIYQVINGNYKPFIKYFWRKDTISDEIDQPERVSNTKFLVIEAGENEETYWEIIQKKQEGREYALLYFE